MLTKFILSRTALKANATCFTSLVQLFRLFPIIFGSLFPESGSRVEKENIAFENRGTRDETDSVMLVKKRGILRHISSLVLQIRDGTQQTFPPSCRRLETVLYFCGQFEEFFVSRKAYIHFIRVRPDSLKTEFQLLNTK